MSFRGDRAVASTVGGYFSTSVNAVPTTLAGTPNINVFKRGSSTPSTAGRTLNVDVNSVTGLNSWVIDTSADGSFYVAGDFDVMISAGTIGGQSVIGMVIGGFSLNSSVVSTVTGNVAGNVTGSIGSVASGGIVAATFASGALDAVWSTTARVLTAGTNIVLPTNGLSSITAWTVALTGNLSGSVGSVSGAVGSVSTRVTANVDQIDGAAWSTHASGMVPADLRDIRGAASVGDAGYVGIDWAQIANPTAVEALTNTSISGSSAPTVSQIATAVWQDTTAGDFIVSGSIGKSLFTSGAVPGTSGGLFIAGSNVTTIVNFTGNLSGSVGSVTGNIGGNVVGSVASVAGNIGGNVVGSVASVVAGVTLAVGAVQAIWDALTSALTTVGSIGKLLVTNIDTTISSRLASGSYTAPPTAAANADAVWDETLASHVTAGSTGQALSTASGGGTSGPNVNVVTWLGDTPQNLIGGRVQVVTMPPAQKWTG